MDYNFESIAGYETEKEELKSLCALLNNREEMIRKGARLPKGIIFYGESGTGKTLFSKVLASVCGLKVIKIDLSAWINEASICLRIRRAFAEAAKQKDGAVILFDEMDKVLPNAEEDYYTDASKAILAQLLTLIDGMSNENNLTFVATCNDYRLLPKPLTRAGRLDKKIWLGYPTYSSRVEILKLYMKKSPCKFALSVEEIARLCAGFSCAEVETLVNECILSSNKKDFISEGQIRQVYASIKHEDISRPQSPKSVALCACLNAGRFVVARSFRAGRYVLDIDKDNMGNEFFNKFLSDFDCYDYDDDDYYEEEYDEDCERDDDDDDYDYDEDYDRVTYYSKEDYKQAATVLLGGYVAEEVLLGEPWDNLENSLRMVQEIFLSMAKNGMFGLNALLYDGDVDGADGYFSNCAENVKRAFDEFLEKCYVSAKEIIEKNQDILKKLMEELQKEKMIQDNRCEKLLKEWGGLR